MTSHQVKQQHLGLGEPRQFILHSQALSKSTMTDSLLTRLNFERFNLLLMMKFEL